MDIEDYDYDEALRDRDDYIEHLEQKVARLEEREARAKREVQDRALAEGEEFWRQAESWAEAFAKQLTRLQQEVDQENLDNNWAVAHYRDYEEDWTPASYYHDLLAIFKTANRLWNERLPKTELRIDNVWREHRNWVMNGLEDEYHDWDWMKNELQELLNFLAADDYPAILQW